MSVWFMVLLAVFVIVVVYTVIALVQMVRAYQVAFLQPKNDLNAALADFVKNPSPDAIVRITDINEVMENTNGRLAGSELKTLMMEQLVLALQSQTRFETVAQKMSVCTELHTRGVISEAEYDETRTAILKTV